MAVKKKEQVKHRGPKEKAVAFPEEPADQSVPQETTEPEVLEEDVSEPEEVFEEVQETQTVCCPMCGASFDVNK